MISTIILWSLIGISALGLWTTVVTVGKDRKPLTPADAIGALALGTLQFYGLIYVLLNL